MRNNEGNPIPRYFPENYSTGINVLGMNFKFRNFFEGVVLAFVLAGLSIYGLSFLTFIDSGTKIGLVLSFALVGLVLGVLGINDEPISVFVMNKMRFTSRKRTAFYNPHIKTNPEARKIPYAYVYKQEKEAMPKERLMAFYRKYKSDLEKSEMAKMVEFQKTNTFDETTMFFKDDEGYFDKPVEYMNASEYRKYLRQVRKQEKKAKKEAKKQEKLARKEAKRQEKLAKKEAKRLEKERRRVL